MHQEDEGPDLLDNALGCMVMVFLVLLTALAALVLIDIFT